jgi:hypothetical protein
VYDHLHVGSDLCVGSVHDRFRVAWIVMGVCPRLRSAFWVRRRRAERESLAQR